jgi:peptidoglycan biosynthesis protein MviN/MurJ (putative lipid II flippase)
MLINALAAPGAMLAVAVGRARLAFVAASVNVAVNAVGSLVLVQHIGLRGALIGSLAGNVCATVLFLGLLRRAEPAHWSRGLTPGPLVSWAALIGLGCLMVRGHSWTALLIGSLGWVVASTLVLLVSGSLGELVRVAGAARQSFATAPVAADTPRSV